MLKKRFLICLVLLVALLVANLAMIQAASTSDLTFTLNSSGDGYVVTGCKSTASGSLSIPSSYNSKPVVEIGRDAFLNCTSLTSVTIPDSVKTIGWYAFSGCTGLTSITIPDSVTTLDWFAFADCTALTKVTVGNGVTCIDASAFAGCTKLSSVTLGNGVTSIGWSAFKGCTQLASINIPHGVTSIERYAFYNCSSLSSVTYCGTSQEWSAITMGEGNDILSSVTVTYHKYSNCVCSLCQDSQHSPADAVKENEKAATCAAAGSYDSVVYCSSCKAEISRDTVSVPATSHTEVIDEAVAATCTESGLTEGKHCSVCNEVLVARTVVDALGHTEQTVPGYAATCTQAGLTDGVICSVCDAVITEQTEIPATGHNYVDGTCTICGDTTVPTDSNLAFFYDEAQLMVGEDIKGYFLFNKKGFTYDEYYAEFKMGDEVTTVPVSMTSGNYLYFFYTVYAFKMTESIEVTLYGVKDDVAYRGKSVTWTIRDAIVAKLDSWIDSYGTDASKTKGCDLLANMLNYGTEAQKELNKENTNYPTDNLDAKYLALIKTTTPEMSTKPTDDEAGKQATAYSIGMMLQERIKLYAMFKVSNASATNDSDYKMVITLTHQDGSTSEYEYGSEDLTFSGTKTKYVTAYFDQIKCQEMRCSMSFALYLNGEQISATIVRSADMLANDLLTKYPTLIPAIMNYSDCAELYFS